MLKIKLKRIESGEYVFEHNGSKYYVTYYRDAGFWDCEYYFANGNSISIMGANTLHDLKDDLNKWINGQTILDQTMLRYLREVGAKV